MSPRGLKEGETSIRTSKRPSFFCVCLPLGLRISFIESTLRKYASKLRRCGNRRTMWYSVTITRYICYGKGSYRSRNTVHVHVNTAITAASSSQRIVFVTRYTNLLRVRLRSFEGECCILRVPKTNQLFNGQLDTPFHNSFIGKT